MATTLAVALPASATLAGEKYVDAAGVVVSGHDVVACRGLARPAVGAPQPPAMASRADITANRNGATFACATVANIDAFRKDPADCAPQFGDLCAPAMTEVVKVPGNPDLSRVVDSKPYLKFSSAASGSWQQDIPGNIAASGGTWPVFDPIPASGVAVPGFTPAAPLRDRPQRRRSRRELIGWKATPTCASQ